jgi:hypothetical protein
VRIQTREIRHEAIVGGLLTAGLVAQLLERGEKTASAGTDTMFHLHRDSDEVAYVLSDEISFKISEGSLRSADWVDNRRRGQRDPSAPRPGDHRSAAFLA